MKRNKKEEKKKELIRLHEERYEIWNAIRNQNLIEMDKPMAHGWDGNWVLRDDIGRSPEAEKLQHIIDTYGVGIWSKRKDFKYKDRKTKRWMDIKPSFKNISESDYEELSDKMKLYFTLDTRYRYGNMWSRTEYMVSIDNWKLKMNTNRSYLTHYREHDEILHQLESENEYNMYNLTPIPWGGYSSAGWWRRSERRKAKTKHRSDNRIIINSYNGGEDLDELNVHTTYNTSSMGYW